jgi:fibronectin-binding autotransporter adhesin
MHLIRVGSGLLCATAMCVVATSQTYAQDYGVKDEGPGPFNVTNPEGQVIEGAKSGIYSDGSSLSVDNAGVIRGNGSYDGFDAAPDGGIVFAGGPADIDNSGTISGQRFGITTAYFFNPQTNQLEPRAIGSTVSNSGSIIGDTDDGVRLIGGGSINNSGTIEGRVGQFADGVSMFAFEGQANAGSTTIGSVTNLAGGTILGNRFGIILSGGGTVDNAGTIGGNVGSVVIQAQPTEAGRTGSLTNSGTLNGYVGFVNLAAASLGNSGAINGPVVFGNVGSATVTNSGSIASQDPETASVESLAKIIVENFGTIGGSFGTHAIRFGDGDDTLILGTGSVISGISDAGAGFDELRLDTEDLADKALGRFDNFETLNLVNGNWSVSGDSGTFQSIAITGGQLSVTGAIAGDVTIGSAGTFRLGDGNALGGFNGNIVNNGTLVVDIGADFELLGEFTGTGLFTKQGDGTIAFLGGYGFSGTTQLLAGGIRIAGAISPDTVFDLQSGTLDLSGSTTTTIAGLSGSSSSNLVLGGLSNLTVNQDADTVFAGAIEGSGSITKDGPGLLNLTGQNTYSGPTIVNGGTLAVNGSITSNVTIASGGTLGGTGTTGTVTIESGGTFAPGNSIGTIDVVGTLRFARNSNYLVEANAAGQADRIDVAGRAIIASGVSVSVLAEQGNYRPSTKYTILTATNGISGQFSSVSTDLAFLEATLNHASKKIELTLKRNSSSFASVAASNQASVASAIEAFGLGSDIYDSVVGQNAAGARAAFNAFSGSFYGTISNEIMSSVQLLSQSLQTPYGSTRGGSGPWALVEIDNLSNFAPQYRSGFNLSQNGFEVSIQSAHVPFDRLASGNNGVASMATQYIGASARYSDDRWSLLAGLGVADHEIEVSRAVTAGDFAEGSSSRYGVSTSQLFAEASYGVSAGRTTLSPFLSASRIALSGTQIYESGGQAALSISGSRRTINIASAGVRAEALLPLGEGASLAPRIELGWRVAEGDLAVWQTSRFVANGAEFGIAAASLSRSGALVDAGVELSLGAVSLSAEYKRDTVLRSARDGAHFALRWDF